MHIRTLSSREKLTFSGDSNFQKFPKRCLSLPAGLGKVLLNFFCIYGFEVFMHDNALSYKAKKVIRHLDQKQINNLEWHGNSLHLNSIKNW